MNESLNNLIAETNFINHNLNTIIEKNNLSNAYIFYGPENTGKKATAVKFISEIIKKNNSNIDSTIKIQDNNHPDYMIVEPTYLLRGNLVNQSEISSDFNQKIKPIIRIEQIRQIKNFLSRKSIQSDIKCIVIIDAHLFNEASSNCLLKTLEEPANGIFILLTSKINLLIDTILSRCQKIKFSAFTNEQLLKIVNESQEIKAAEIQKIANIDDLIFISNGSPGKLLKNLRWVKKISKDIILSLKYPDYNYEEALKLAKIITEDLNLSDQEILLDYLQCNWWRKTHRENLVNCLEDIKKNIVNNIQPRLAWEVGLLRIII